MARLTPKVTPLELTTKLMEAAKARGAEVRIATVSGVSSAPVDPPSDEAKGESKKGGGGTEEGGHRITAVVLENGEEIPCDRVRENMVSMEMGRGGVEGGGGGRTCQLQSTGTCFCFFFFKCTVPCGIYLEMQPPPS